MAEIKKAKISKRTNRKQNFKKFIESDYKDYQKFLNACKNDENLLIYTCLTHDELAEVIEKMKEYPTLDEQIKYLINNQPIANATPERFNRVTESIARYLKGYIEFNGFKMSNSDGSSEDWSAEFWAKFCKICDFYRTRWFYPEKLKKASTVTFNPVLYKEFIYICRMSITGDRKHKAFLATQNEGSSIFKISLDNKLDVNDNDKTLADVIPAEKDGDYMDSEANVKSILQKALFIAKQYPDALNCYDKIESFYDKQDTAGFDKKTVMLGKIFLYKAGLYSPKILTFIKGLSTTYKSRYNISNSRVNTQLLEYKKVKPVKYNFQKKKKTTDMTYRDLIFHKRGELDYEINDDDDYI